MLQLKLNCDIPISNMHVILYMQAWYKFSSKKDH